MVRVGAVRTLEGREGKRLDTAGRTLLLIPAPLVVEE
jgi:hypothetical protein